jgi:hypothetical protein
MSIEQAKIDLARRAISSKAWRWMHDLVLMPLPETLPDFDSFATKGCLVQMVREAWCDPLASTAARSLKEWAVTICKDGEGPMLKFVGRSEVEALVSALEARHGTKKTVTNPKTVCDGCCKDCLNATILEEA